jgi:hypothetical protein
MSTLSARWPGALGRFQKEADHWQRNGYGDLNVEFLSRAFAGVLFGGGLSSWSLTDISKVDDERLQRAWETVQRGLKRLVPLLTTNLKLTRSAPLPSLLPLIPLVVLLGERDDKKMEHEITKAIIYWLLVAIIRTRYSSSTDVNLSRDIQAARKNDPTGELLKNIGVLQARPEITPESLAGRTKESPYFFLSLLVAQHNGARDLWYDTDIIPGPAADQEIEYHHIHPVATLGKYEKGDINDLANLAFISRKANRKISDKSPAEYFPSLEDTELTAHYIPLEVSLRRADAFPKFLAERRRLLAAAMTDLLDIFRPEWLKRLPVGPAATADSYKLTMVLYGSAWAPGRLVFRATGPSVFWVGSVDMADLTQALTAAGAAGIDSDVEIAGETVPVEVVEDSIVVPIGPFLVSGSPDEWEEVLGREQTTMQALGRLPSLREEPWTGDRITLSVTSTD